MQTRFCVRRGHSAAVYTSGCWSTSLGQKNTLFIMGSHTGAPVYTIGVSPSVKLVQNRYVFKLAKINKYFFILQLCQNRQLFPTSKQCFIFLFLSSNICVLSIPIYFYIGEKRLGGHHSSKETTDPPPHEKVEIPQSQAEEEEGDVVEIVTITGDRDVVDEGNFTSESAQILIGVIMECNRDLENIKQNINDVQNKMKNIIDVLGRV
ncbi:hypothetical protein AB205_0079590 [Aquarana catesbeiana]|uniref:Uncharacterized protein n=1 Tax=Aquarana catesbeiana TaxID=8400 RepID=A0A2G9RWQ8_AQUCT|nr:hypothetical protein AB205_0079590 [Aquarana catesbeiana]